MEYMLVKWLHILASTLLFGTGIGSAFYMLFANLNRQPHIIAFVTRQVVIADWLFTATTIVFQPVSGFYLAYLAGVPLDSGWIQWSIVLYTVGLACWLPVTWLQIRMRDVSGHAAAHETDLPPEYWRYFRAWVALGFPALFAFIAVFYLMVAKPL